ncbi:hypothetical protein FLK61_36730 [Paenalkalicoccus suaedae]|uniref:Uncharacterized protein n=1 Tax=Paenalkalicoccus suaedae TaxID=2592382 RepID=A0A859FHC2_9BACI|nr:hypothetical protein [Paenalkalicoccus suaedae]QKS72190.1 hypothetical protein FLK61_36730 [Paenalkalicoccus suaedae]
MEFELGWIRLYVMQTEEVEMHIARVRMQTSREEMHVTDEEMHTVKINADRRG